MFEHTHQLYGEVYLSSHNFWNSHLIISFPVCVASWYAHPCRPSLRDSRMSLRYATTRMGGIFHGMTPNSERDERVRNASSIHYSLASDAAAAAAFSIIFHLVGPENRRRRCFLRPPFLRLVCDLFVPSFDQSSGEKPFHVSTHVCTFYL